MTITLTIAAALLLALERITYALAWHRPTAFHRLCSRLPAAAGAPVDVMSRLFVAFKIIQIGVFLGWWTAMAEQPPPLPTAEGAALALGVALFLGGQVLNFAVFARLGKVGVFYGNRFGHDVPWIHGFPFSLVPHPQYVGTLISIWGAFVVMRYPHPDWIILPLLETAYYGLAVVLER